MVNIYQISLRLCLKNSTAEEISAENEISGPFAQPRACFTTLALGLRQSGFAQMETGFGLSLEMKAFSYDC